MTCKRLGGGKGWGGEGLEKGGEILAKEAEEEGRREGRRKRKIGREAVQGRGR